MTLNKIITTEIFRIVWHIVGKTVIKILEAEEVTQLPTEWYILSLLLRWKLR